MSNTPGKRGPKHAPDLRTVVDAMLYVSHTGCQWRYLPESFGPWTRVWSQFRRWPRNGSWARALAVLHAAARERDGRTRRRRACSGPAGTPSASTSLTAVSDAPGAWPSRSRTPPLRRPGGCRSHASPRRCATCHGNQFADAQPGSQLDDGAAANRADRARSGCRSARYLMVGRSGRFVSQLTRQATSTCCSCGWSTTVPRRTADSAERA